MRGSLSNEGSDGSILKSTGRPSTGAMIHNSFACMQADLDTPQMPSTVFSILCVLYIAMHAESQASIIHRPPLTIDPQIQASLGTKAHAASWSIQTHLSMIEPSSVVPMY